MKAYLVVSGYEDEYEYNVDSVFLDRKEAESYVKENNQIPYDKYDVFRIEEVELNPPTIEKKIVVVHGNITKDNEIHDLEIVRIDREILEWLKDFAGDDIDLHSGMYYGVVPVIFFDGKIDVTPCKDLSKCHEYIKDVIMEKLKHYNPNERDDKI